MASKFIPHPSFLYCILIFIGFANAIPVALMGSTLSIWLTESGYDKETIGFFALLGIPFSFKIFWTPIIDQYKCPLLPFGSRKGWLVFALAGMGATIYFISTLDPALSPYTLAVSSLILTVFTSCLYIVGLAYELESIEEKNYGMGSACVITGYRIGLVCAGSGVLLLSYLWNWSLAIKCLAGLIALGIIAILLQPEPYKSALILQEKKRRFLRYPSLFQGFCQEAILQPCRAFFQKSDWMVVLLLVVTFKMGDHMAKSMEGPFYLSLGFNKAELAFASKLWGMASTIFGAFIAGIYVRGRNASQCLVWAGLIHAFSLTGYYVLSLTGKSMPWLCATVALEHFTSGLAITTFIFFLWSICDKQFAAVQYAILWSAYSIKADLFACLGGILASNYGWNVYFSLVAAFAVVSSLAIWGLVFQLHKKAAATNSTRYI